MSRPGITVNDVACAVMALSRAGVSPTARMIREFIGSGSYTTIYRHLDEISQRDGGVVDYVHNPKELDVSDTLAALIISQNRSRNSAAEVVLDGVISELAEWLVQLNSIFDRAILALSSVESLNKRNLVKIERLTAVKTALKAENSRLKLQISRMGAGNIN